MAKEINAGLQIVYRKLSEMHPNPKNPRKQGDDGIVPLAESIEANPQFFEARPILLSDRTGKLVIIGGERRWEAAQYLEIENAPSILFHGLTEEQEDEIMVRDNTHAGKWDVEKLVSSWGGATLKTWGIDETYTHAHDWDKFARISDEDAPADPSLFFRVTIKVPGVFLDKKQEIIETVKTALAEYDGLQIGSQK